MSLDNPVILTCAISGAVAKRDRCPAIPYTPEEYAAEARRIDMGVLKPPLQVSCVMGVTGGIRPTTRKLAHTAEQVPDVQHQWGVIGISRDQWMLVAAAPALGGNVRVGLEDNFYLPNGEMARSNGDLVAKARAMAEDAGRRVATVAEVRERLETPKRAAA